MVNLCNTSFMPIFEGKRLEFVGVKINQAEKEQFEQIAKDEDRAMSYVVRELALRGLVQYLKDKNIKTTNEEIKDALKLLENQNKTQVYIGDKPAAGKKKKVGT